MQASQIGEDWQTNTIIKPSQDLLEWYIVSSMVEAPKDLILTLIFDPFTDSNNLLISEHIGIHDVWKWANLATT